MTGGTTHPEYAGVYTPPGRPAEPTNFRWLARIGDEVALASHLLGNVSLGVVTDIHGESFGDGPGDTITVHPAAVTLSSGDRYPMADLVLLRRAEQ